MQDSCSPQEQQAVALVERLRADRSTWNDVAFASCHTEERGTYDGNAVVRFRVLLTLQYDRRETDAELIRHLFTQEIIAAEEDSFSDDEIQLAAFLLARFREPTDAVLFARAKLANFDTACGFPLEFFFIAGGEQAEQILQANDQELWEDLSSSPIYLTRPDDLDGWWRSICDEFPDAEAAESLLARYDRAWAFDDRERALSLLQQWAREEPDSESKQFKLKFEYARLEEFEQAADIADEMAESSEGHRERASALLDVVKFRRQAGEFAASLRAAQELDCVFTAFDDWRTVGLGRMAIHEVFELSQVHPNLDDACEAFTLADRWFQVSGNLAFVGMQAGAKAAERCGLKDQVEEYERIAAEERRRIDEELGRE